MTSDKLRMWLIEKLKYYSYGRFLPTQLNSLYLSSFHTVCLKLHGRLASKIYVIILSNGNSIRSFHFDKGKEMETTLLILEPFTFLSQMPMFLLLPCLNQLERGDVFLLFRKVRGLGKENMCQADYQGKEYIQHNSVSIQFFITGAEAVSLIECLVPV